MPSPLFTSSTMALCPHGGRIFAPSQARVIVGGAPVLTVLNAGMITGCPCLAGDRPDPCISVRWDGHTTRVLIEGQPAVLQAGAGVSLTAAQEPAGPVSVISSQERVKAV